MDPAQKGLKQRLQSLIRPSPPSHEPASLHAAIPTGPLSATMDPLTAFGLAANVLSVVQFSYDLAGVLREIKNKGSTQNNQDIAKLTTRLQSITSDLASPQKEGAQLSDDLRSLVSDCSDLSTELLGLLGKSSTSGKTGRWTTIKALWHSTTQKNKIESMHEALERYQNQIILHIVGMTRSEVASIGELTRHNKARVHEIESASKRVEALVQSCFDSQRFGAPAFEEMQKSLALLETYSRAAKTEDRVLELLAFDIMFEREDKIHPAPGTLEWVAGTPNSEGNPENTLSPLDLNSTTVRDREQARKDLVTWMRSGRGIFHITGKPGAGKSTLMKYISKNILDRSQLYNDLVHWAGDRSLVIARFFFYASGKHLQKSLEGLQRSILFQCLRQNPSMVEKVFPDQMKTIRGSHFNRELLRIEQFRPSDINRGFERLLEMEPTENHRFCILVDGLDEYCEDDDDETDLGHIVLANKLQAWSASGFIKFCVSSREQNAFTTTFQGAPRIRLHEVTRIDIHALCCHLVQEAGSDIFPPGFDVKFLVKCIVNRADGVFLWADIAMRAALVDASRGDDLDTILKKLDSPPGKIRRLYANLLGAMSETERKEAYAILAVATRLRDSLSSIAYTWLHDLAKPDFPDWRAGRLSLNEIQHLREKARRRIQGYTKGFLTISNTRTTSHGTVTGYVDEVSICHRSLREYLSRDDICSQTELQSFYPQLSDDEILARLKLAELSRVWGVEDGDDAESPVPWSLSLLGPLEPEYDCAGRQLSALVLDRFLHLANGIPFEKTFVGGGIGPFYEGSGPPEGFNPVLYLAAFHNQGLWIRTLTGTHAASRPHGQDWLPSQSPLCSAVLGSADDAVQELLEWETDIHQPFYSLSLRPEKAREAITVCDILAYQTAALACNAWTVTGNPSRPNATCNILEMFLAKQMNPVYTFVIEGFYRYETDEKKWRCVMTLEEAVEIIKPANIGALRNSFTAGGGKTQEYSQAANVELEHWPRLSKDQRASLKRGGFIEGMFRGNVEITHDFRGIIC